MRPGATAPFIVTLQINGNNDVPMPLLTLDGGGSFGFMESPGQSGRPFFEILPPSPSFSGDPSQRIDRNDARNVIVINSSHTFGTFDDVGDENYYPPVDVTSPVDAHVASHVYFREVLRQQCLDVDEGLTPENTDPEIGASQVKPPGLWQRFVNALFIRDTARVDVVGSHDPNEIVGPVGVDDDRFIAITDNMPFTIRFENDPDLATAPAQIVTDILVTGPLSKLTATTANILDAVSVSGAVGSVTFGDLTSGPALDFGGNATNKPSTIKIGRATGLSLTSTGAINSITLVDWNGGDLTAPAIGSFKVTGLKGAVAGDLFAAIFLSQNDPAKFNLNSLSVAGSFSHSQFTSNGKINALTVGTLNDTDIYIGADQNLTGLATSDDSFTSMPSSTRGISARSISKT